MLPITRLSMINPNDAEPGTLLIGCGHYDRPPMFVFEFGENKFRFDFGEGGDHTEGFIGLPMAMNLSQYLYAGEPTVLVDVNSRISPTRSDIPYGSIALFGDVATFVIKLGYGTAYVRIDGSVLDDPRAYENLVAFGHWTITIPANGEDQHLVYESRLVQAE